MGCFTSFQRTSVALVALSLLVLQASGEEGCFWISRCQNKRMGGCRPGYIQVDASNDCKGLCAEPQYPACSSFFTRFQCCTEVKAREGADCAQCTIKVDLGDEWLCCSDCSEPQITDADAQVGYCQMGASLGSQSKPREVFRWNTGEWTPCSRHCGEGVRKRHVKCLRYVEHVLNLPAVVDDSECLAATMVLLFFLSFTFFHQFNYLSMASKPAREEVCNLTACQGIKPYHKKRHLPIWAIVLISLSTVAAAGGLAFASYLVYKRRTENSNHGFVYVMLEGY